jgi:hypothetical protein
MHYSDHSNDVALEIVSSSDDQPRVLLSAVLVGKSAAAPGDKDRTRHVVINGIMDSVQARNSGKKNSRTTTVSKPSQRSGVSQS